MKPGNYSAVFCESTLPMIYFKLLWVGSPLACHCTWPFVHAEADHINSCGAGMNLLNSFKVHLCIVFTPRLVPMWDGGCIRKISEIKTEKLAKSSFSLGPGAFPIQQRNLLLSLHVAQDILPYKILYFTCNILRMVCSTPFCHHRRISRLLTSNMSLPPSLL